MNSIRIVYDGGSRSNRAKPEGDILDIIFSFSEPENRTGFELNENIVIYTDKEISRALGITFISSEPVKYFLRVIIPPTPCVSA